MRGAFAAPAALTLCSGGAFAASSAVRCVANQVNSPVLPNASATADTWVRVRLWTMGGTPVNTQSTWISGADLAAVVAGTSATSYLSSTQWQAFSAQSASVYTAGQTVNGPPATPGASPPLTQDGLYVAVRFDATGNIIGVVGISGTSGGSAVANTCWTSFKVG